MSRYDVIIVGAGPAGSAAALAVLQADPRARVALVDASSFPRDKACGDGIAPQALHVLEELGVPDAARGFMPVGRLRLRSPLGREVVAQPREAAYCIPRLVFDARLVEAAEARGAVVMQRRIRTLTIEADGVVLAPDLTARVVIAADGANSTIRRLLSLPPNPPHTSAIAMRGYAAGAQSPGSPDGSPEQLIEMVAAGWPAYAWSFPISGPGHPDGANVGFGMLRSSLETRQEGALGARRSPGRSPSYCPISRPTRRRCAPTRCRSRRFARASPTGAYCSWGMPRHSSIPLQEKGFTTPCSPGGSPARRL